MHVLRYAGFAGGKRFESLIDLYFSSGRLSYENDGMVLVAIVVI